MALGKMGGEAKSAVPELVKLLRHDIIRPFAASALGQIGPNAKEAVPQLLEILRDDTGYSRIAAACALWEIGRQAKVVLPALMDGLKEKNAHLRHIALLGLIALKTEASSAVPSILKLVGDDHYPIRWSVAVAIREIGLNNKETTGALRILLDDKEIHVRLHAAQSLWKLTGDTTHLAVLTTSLKNDDKAVRVIAANILGSIGAAAKNAIPALRQATLDKESEVATAAREAIKKIEAK